MNCQKPGSTKFALSQASTVPFELSQGQDTSFVEELNQVDSLYFVGDEGHVELYEDNAHITNSDDDIVSNDDDDDDDDNGDTNTNNTDNVIPYENRPEDNTEILVQLNFHRDTCKCTDLYKGQPCSTIVDFQKLVEYRENCSEMGKDERDLIIKSQLFAHRKTSHIAPNKVRQRASQDYYFMGTKVCRATFCFANYTNRKVLQSIASSLDKDGLKPRVHGNTGKKSHNSLSLVDTERIKTFITEYAVQNALPLPGRLPNCERKTVLLLPSDKKVPDIHELYEISAREAGFRSTSLKSFRRIWSDQCSHINVAKPTTDLCQKCQVYGTSLNNAGQLTEHEKQELIESFKDHIEKAQSQRNGYREEVLTGKQLHANMNLLEGAAPCSVDATFHYSWDYAQQVHYPHHAQQVGPIFFKTPRKCHIFGVCAEGSARQTFYLIDEAQCIGKGADSVVSMVHHYFQNYGIGEKHAQVHFDNATGQNKNNIVISYALWRVLTGLHEAIDLSMMVAGHTKFTPDWHFGIWKVKWRDSDAETMNDIASSVRQSSKGGHNIPQLIDDPDKPVVFFSWKQFLSRYFKPLKNLTKFHHFSVNSAEPGVVTCKEFVNSEEVKVTLINQAPPTPDVMPEEKPMPGLNAARQWYLYEQIGQFFRNGTAKASICPKPVVPKVEVDLETVNSDRNRGSKRKSSLLC